MPISFPFPPSSGQQYDYLSQSWIYNGTYWASIRASGAVTSGQLGTPVVFSGNIASGQIGTNQLASGVWSIGSGSAAAYWDVIGNVRGDGEVNPTGAKIIPGGTHEGGTVGGFITLS